MPFSRIPLNTERESIMAKFWFGRSRDAGGSQSAWGRNILPIFMTSLDRANYLRSGGGKYPLLPLGEFGHEEDRSHRANGRPDRRGKRAGRSGHRPARDHAGSHSRQRRQP